MRKILLLLSFASVACAQQSYHIIKLLNVGEADFCGDTAHFTTCVKDQVNAAGTIITTTGSRVITGNGVIGSLDNAYLAVDASGNLRAGLTKKSGAIPRFTYGSGINFEVAQSNAADIGSSNTFTTHFALAAATGAPSFTFSSASTGAIFTQSGAGEVISINVSNASPAIHAANTSSGAGGAFSSSSGDGVDGTSSTGNGIGGTTSIGIGVVGLASGGGGIGGSFSAVGLGGVGLFASGPLAAHFGSGDVHIDNSLTVNTIYGLTSAGALTVASCTGCGGGGGVTSFNTRTGPVLLLKADVTAVDQALGTGDSPTFAGGTFNGVTSVVANTAGCALCVTNNGAGYALQTNPGQKSLLDGPVDVTSFFHGFGAGAISGSFSVGTVGVSSTFSVNGTGLSSIAAALSVGGNLTVNTIYGLTSAGALSATSLTFPGFTVVDASENIAGNSLTITGTTISTPGLTFNGHVCSLVSTVMTCP